MNCNLSGILSMKVNLWLGGLFCVFYLLVPAASFASSPEETIRAVVSELKASGNLSPLVKHIDWERQYGKLSDDEKKGRGFANAEELRMHYAALATANGSGVLERLKSEADSAPPAERNKALELVSTVEQELTRQQAILREALSQMQYTVGSVKSDSETSVTVNLEKNKGVAIESTELRLHLVNGEWLLENGAPLNPIPSPYAGEPLGALPEAIAIIGQP
jgi:hypothetical protein